MLRGLMSKKDNTVSAALVIIGNEILSGRTQDANLNYLAKQLTSMGIQMSEVRAIRDDTDEIIDAVNSLRKRFDYVFTTGGIGPTHDDITCESIAKAFGRKYILNLEAKTILEEYYDGSSRELNEARLRMAYTPEGASLIENPVSRAPGFMVENVIVLAGIPAVMRAMFESLAPTLRTGKKVLSRSISVMTGEGDIARSLANIQKSWETVEIGCYPFVRDGKYGTTLVLRGSDKVSLDGAHKNLLQAMEKIGVTPEIDK